VQRRPVGGVDGCLASAAVVPAAQSGNPRRRGWRPAKCEWLRAVRGKSGRILFGEKEARLVAEHLAALPSGGTIFPNLVDRLLVAKCTWIPHEIITIRYTLGDFGFWGPGGPSPLEVGRRLQLGAKPFVAAVLIGQDEASPSDALIDGVGARLEHRAPVDPHIKGGTLLLRAPAGYNDSGEGGDALVWHLRLFASEDGVTPSAVLSQPLPIRILTMAPAPPSSVLGSERTHDSVTLAWPPSINHGGAPILIYEVSVWEAESFGSADGQLAVWSGQTVERLIHVTHLQPNCAYIARDVEIAQALGRGACRRKASSQVRRSHPR